MKFSELPIKSAFSRGRNIFIKVNERQYFTTAGLTLRNFPNPDIECELKAEDVSTFFSVEALIKRRAKQFNQVVQYGYFMIDDVAGVHQKLDCRFALNLETFEIIELTGLTIANPVHVYVHR